MTMNSSLWKWEKSSPNTYYRYDANYGLLTVVLSDFNNKWWLSSPKVLGYPHSQEIRIFLGDDIYGVDLPPLMLVDNVMYALGCRPETEEVIEF